MACRFSKGLATVATAAFLLTGQTAQAACLLGDVAGDWLLYGAGATNQGAYAVRCRLLVQTNGKISSGTRCSYSTGVATAVTGGLLQVSRACMVSGHLNEKLGSRVTKTTITQATLSQEKNLIAGVAWVSPEFVLFNAMKR